MELVSFVKDADPRNHPGPGEPRPDVQGRTISYTHTYPFCWRCDTPLLYYARGTWFIRTSAVQGPTWSEVNKQIHWVSQTTSADGRFGNWLENNIDWSLWAASVIGARHCRCGSAKECGPTGPASVRWRTCPRRFPAVRPGPTWTCTARYVDNVIGKCLPGVQRAPCTACTGADRRVV